MTIVTGTNGANGTNNGNGKNGTAATYSFNGMLNADSQTITATGGNGGAGGTGAKGGNGGDATIAVNGNIFNPLGSLEVITTATGGNGGLGGTGTPASSQGNGGNASVTIDGNIISTSQLLSDITLDAVALAGLGAQYGNATAAVNGNIITYNNATATNVVLDAAALANGPDSPANNGNTAFGTKTAAVNGNIITGNVANLSIFADAYLSNGSATISGNIFTAKPTNTGVVTLGAEGQKIAITGNILNLGTQSLALDLDELGPTYSANVSGNIFNGTGANTFILADTQDPGPPTTPDVANINLATNSFTFDGQSNTINKFGSIQLSGDVQGDLIGTSGNNTLNASGDTTTGTLIFAGNGGTDTITGAPHALNVVQFAGSDWQYTINMTAGNGTVVGGPTGDTSNDTLNGIQRLKFLSPSHVSDVNDDGYGDLVFQNSANGNIKILTQGPSASTITITTPPAAWAVVGTGEFTADTDRNSDLLLQKAVSGQLEIISSVASGSPVTTLVSGVTPGFDPTTTFMGWKAVATGDFNGDGASDVLLQQGTGGPVEIAFMNTIAGQAPGTVDQISAVTSPTGGNWKAISSGDFNGDGNSDILWQNTSTGAVDVSLMNGATGTPTSVTSVGNVPAGFTAIGTGDFNGDGKSDILLGSNTMSNAQIWLMNGTTEVGSPINITGPGAGWTLLGAEDVNKDGSSDLLWQNSSTGKVDVQEMTTGGVPLGGLISLGSPSGSAFHLIASTGGG